MLRLKSILIATVISAPMVINAADFTTTAEAKHGYFINMAKDTAEDAEYKTTNTFVQGNTRNLEGAAVGFKFKGENLSGLVKLGVALTSPNVSISDWFVKYDLDKNLFFKLGRYGSPFGIKNVDNYLGQGGAGGKYGTSTPNVNLTLGFSGVQISLAPNDGVAVVDPQLIKNKAGQAVSVWIPKLALAYDYSNDMIRAGASTVLNVTQQDFLKSGTTDTTSMSFMGWAAGAHFRLHVSKVWIQLNGVFAINGDLAGIAPMSKVLIPPATAAVAAVKVKIEEGSAKNYTMIGLPVSIGVDLTDMILVNAGFGMYVEKEGVKDAKANTGMQIVAGLKISKLLTGLTVWPEFMYSQNKLGDDNPKTDICFGVGSKWAF